MRMNENMNLIEKRNITVNYNQISDELWETTAELVDNQHDMKTLLEIDTTNMTVRNARIVFKKCPLEQCLQIQDKAKELIGCLVFDELSHKLDELFKGALGCPNVRNLFGASGPGFIYVYYPNLVQEGTISKEEWWKIVETKLSNVCIAHTALSKIHKNK